jgi:acetyltransferase-like isoleucine patch superfamily enzyme
VIGSSPLPLSRVCHLRLVSESDIDRTAREVTGGARVERPPIGADAVIPARGPALASWVRLAWMRLRSHGRLEAGSGVRVSRGVRMDAATHVRLGDGCLLGTGCRIGAPGGPVHIGARARIGDRSVIVALAGITVGDDAVIGEWAVLSDAFPDAPDVERPVRQQPLVALPIDVGAGARIGAHAALGAGARIAPGAAVGSYAVVPTPAAPPTSP